jgi:hypothetical protein
LLSAISIARAHTVITYPGWRGNNLHSNGTLPQQNPGSLGIDFFDNGTAAFPWGQQWIYPCKRNVHDNLCEANDRLIRISRRWHATVDESNQVASPRRRPIPSTRLVSRPQLGHVLRQHRHPRTWRPCTSQHVTPGRSALSACRTRQQRVRRPILPATNWNA